MVVCTYKDGHHVHAMAFDNVRIRVALFVKVRVEDVGTMVDRSTLFPLRARRHSGHEILVVFFGFFDKGREFLLVSEKSLPPRFERGTTTNRCSRVWDSASLDSKWFERDAQWKIHEFL